MEKRYIVELDYYLYSKTDKKATKKAKKLEKKLSKYLDKINGESRLKLRAVYNNEFGDFVTKKVEL